MLQDCENCLLMHKHSLARLLLRFCLLAFPSLWMSTHRFSSALNGVEMSSQEAAWPLQSDCIKWTRTPSQPVSPQLFFPFYIFFLFCYDLDVKTTMSPVFSSFGNATNQLWYYHMYQSVIFILGSPTAGFSAHTPVMRESKLSRWPDENVFLSDQFYFLVSNVTYRL